MEAFERACIDIFAWRKRERQLHQLRGRALEFTGSAIELSWYPNIFDKFHEVRITLARSNFSLCRLLRLRYETPHFRKDGSGHTASLVLRLCDEDAIGVKAALGRSSAQGKLVDLRHRVDAVAARLPGYPFLR